MKRVSTALLVVCTVAALLVPPAVAGVAVLPDCHHSDQGEHCACCCLGESERPACCHERTGDRSVTHEGDCGTCPLGNCCGCCTAAAPLFVHAQGIATAAAELAVPLAGSTDVLTTRSDEPLLPPPIG